VADRESELRQCPFCLEEINAAAVRCKHCQAAISPLRPDHEGICPFCKEEINVEAIRCKHCQADLSPDVPLAHRRSLRQLAAPLAFIPRRLVPRRFDRQGSARVFARESVCPGCNDYDIDDAGTWCFLECSEHFCIYELCDPVPVSPYPIFR
jgi:hypothetical protein